MRLTRIEIEGFGTLQGMELRFGPTMNLVVGPNEAGKSTLQEAIVTGLYGLQSGDRAHSALVERADRWRPWQGGNFGLALEVLLDDGTALRIERDLDAETVRVVDVGTGDARVAHRIAKAQPTWVVIGIDPAWQRMTETSVRSNRKPAKGGTPNLVLVNASIENVPPDLRNLADEVLVLMPWGRLLRGIVGAETDVCGGLRAVAKLGATLDVIVGTSVWRDPVPREIQGLPELTPHYIDATLADRLRPLGWEVRAAKLIEGAEIGMMSSSWWRRLGATTREVVIHLHAVATAPDATAVHTPCEAPTPVT